MFRKLLILGVFCSSGIWACNLNAPNGKPAHETKPNTAVGQARTPESAAKLAPETERSARVVPVAGSPTREQLLNEMEEMMPPLVEPPQLLSSLDEANQAVEHFAVYAETPGEAKVLLAHFSNHDVRNHDLRELVTHTSRSMRDVPDVPPSQTYTASDTMTYPRVLVVWQFPNLHKVLRINLNNDNTAVYFWVGIGEFSAKVYGLNNLKKVSPNKPVLEAASFLDNAMTIYPHIEEYFVCPPQCE